MSLVKIDTFFAPNHQCVHGYIQIVNISIHFDTFL